MMKLILFSLIFTSSIHVSAQLSNSKNKTSDSKIGFLNDFIGDWYTVADKEMLKNFPDMANAIGLKFQWRTGSDKMMDFYEGVRDGDISKAILSCLVLENPRSGEVIFHGYQSKNNFYYVGRFEPLKDKNGFIRIYDVYYPEDTEFRNETDRMKGFKTYRDICKLSSKDSMSCTVEQLNAGLWEPWGSGKPWLMIRKN